MTDAPARQDTPDDESGGPSSDNGREVARVGQGTQVEEARRAEDGSVPERRAQSAENLPVPQWSAQQPAPAPWFLGQSGPVPQHFPPPVPFPPQQTPQGQHQYPPVPMAPGQTPPGHPAPTQTPPTQTPPEQAHPIAPQYTVTPQYPVPPLPPPTQDQANWPDLAPGTRTDPGSGQAEDRSGQDGESGRTQQQQQLQQPGKLPAAGPPRAPGQSPGPALGPHGSPQQPAPWLDPNRYNQTGKRPPQHDPRSPYRPQQPQQQQRGTEPGKRPPLSLRTRWARGLSLGAAACTLITLLTGYRNFPNWLIAAGAGLAMSLGGLWFGTFAQRDALRKAQRAPEAVASVVWSSLSALIALAIVAYSLIFYPQLRQYSDCMRTANTISAQNTCQQQFEHSLVALP